MLYSNIIDLNESIKDSTLEFSGKMMVINEALLREKDIDELVLNAIFNKDDKIFAQSRILIRDLAVSMGIKSASIQPLYEAMGRGEVRGFTVPAINIRGLTYETAKAIFRSMITHKVGPVIFEIAKSEIEYTMQRPSEYSTVIIAAAIKEGFKHPIFIQGDHFQINAQRYSEDSSSEIGSLKTLIKEAVEAGFYNIDIDASTLVDLSKESVVDQQRPNFETTEALTQYIRSIEGVNDNISIGGEIGEVGTKNSTKEELTAFMDGYRARLAPGQKGISKISIQTGTSHGGVVSPDGSIASVDVDFDCLEALGKIAREQYGLAGVVQHGASTLPDESFHIFAEKGTAEVHLATGFQNILLDSTHFPATFKKDITQYLKMKHINEKKPGQTDEQFIYKTRKKCFGPFKEKFFKLSDEIKGKLAGELQARFDMLFTSLNVTNTEDLLTKYYS